MAAPTPEEDSLPSSSSVSERTVTYFFGLVPLSGWASPTERGVIQEVDHWSFTGQAPIRNMSAVASGGYLNTEAYSYHWVRGGEDSTSQRKRSPYMKGNKYQPGEEWQRPKTTKRVI